MKYSTILLACSILIMACSNPTASSPNQGGNGSASNYRVAYDGNGSGSGTAPVDSASYAAGATATVKSAGTLAKADAIFKGWNTAANGSGTAYAAGASLGIGGNVTLYAQWAASAVTSAGVKSAVAKLPTFATVVPSSIAAKTVRGLSAARSALGESDSGTMVYGDNYSWDSIPAYYSDTYSKLMEYKTKGEDSMVNKMVSTLKAFTAAQTLALDAELDFTSAFFEDKAISKIRIVPSTDGSNSFEVFWTMLVFSKDAATGLYTAVNASAFSQLTITNNADGTIAAKVAMNVFGKIDDDGTLYRASSTEEQGEIRMQYHASYDEALGKNIAYAEVSMPLVAGVPAPTTYSYDASTALGGVTEAVSQMYMDSMNYDDRIYLWADDNDGMAVRLFKSNTLSSDESGSVPFINYAEDFYHASVNIFSRVGFGTGVNPTMNYNYRWPIQFLRPLDGKVLVEYKPAGGQATVPTLYLAPAGTTASSFDPASQSLAVLPYGWGSGENYLSLTTLYQDNGDGTATTLAKNALAWNGPKLSSASYQPAKDFSFTKEAEISAAAVARVAGWQTMMVDHLPSYSHAVVAPSSCPALSVSKALVLSNGAFRDK